MFLKTQAPFRTNEICSLMKGLLVTHREKIKTSSDLSTYFKATNIKPINIGMNRYMRLNQRPTTEPSEDPWLPSCSYVR